MTKADQAFVDQMNQWMETQKNSINYNMFLIDQFESHIEMLKRKVELETAEREANQKTLEAHKAQLAQFIEERKDFND